MHQSTHNIYNSHKVHISHNSYNLHNKPTRSRFKIKPNDKLSIYDIFIIKMLRDTTDELYLYVDDRTISSQTTQKKIDDIINILKLFDIKLPEMIVRYTDYYETAWVYLHRLVTLNKALLNYSTVCRSSDLHMMTKSKNVKIFYNNKDKNKRYDNILYDCGWYRDIFIEILMDYSERIDKIVDEVDTLDDGYHTFLTNLCQELNFPIADKLFTNLIMTIKHINRNNMNNTNNVNNINNMIDNSVSPHLSNISIEHIHKLGIDMMMIRDMLENNDDSLLKYAHKMDMNSDNAHIIFDQNKEIILSDKKINIKGIILDNSELITLQLDPQHLQSVKIRIISVGCIKIENEYPDYTGNIQKFKKMQKQKNIKIISKWTPIIYDEYISNKSILKSIHKSNETECADIITISKINILNQSNIMYNIDSKLYILDTTRESDYLNHTLISWNMWIQTQMINEVDKMNK